jgi:UDP-N-acetylmuramyl tripeptide synthase
VSFRFFTATLAGTVVGKILQFLPFSGGGAAPGLLALTLDPDFIKHQAQRFQDHLVVSGTNGKTTTARMISTIFQTAGLSHIHNRSGSNLLRGIASTLLSSSSIIHHSSVGLWEVDEAVLPSAIAQLKPKIVVLTNLFRDQLDRYGEIDTLAEKWLAALKRLPKTSLVILNGDDANLIYLGLKLKRHPVLFYGISRFSGGAAQPTHAADATFCPRCLRPLQYHQVFYSHLGIFSCSCGFRQPLKAFAATRVRQTTKSTNFTLVHRSRGHALSLPLTGLFNLYNALAAVALARQYEISWTLIRQALSRFRPAFGRMESIRAHHKTLHFLLVKNPTGFNQTITTLQGKKTLPLLLFALNDKLADGTDVSWIWDVDLEQLAKRVKTVIVSGTRAHDLALRLKYAGFPQNTVRVLPDLKQSLEAVLQAKKKQVYLLPTYTAMLRLRHLLVQKGLIHASWED